MKIKKYNITSTFIVLLGLLFSASVCGAGQARKPLPPLRISIAPVQAGTTQNQIKPGDVIEFRVTAVSFVDAASLNIKVKLTGGAELVSGELSWTGPAAKNEEKTVLLTIKAPETGKGSIEAQDTAAPSGGARFSAGARYVLGPTVNSKPEQQQPVKKDSKGRNVIEYR